MSYLFFNFSSFLAFFLINKVFLMIPFYLYYCIIRYNFLFYFLRSCSGFTVYISNLYVLPLNNTMLRSTKIWHQCISSPLTLCAVVIHFTSMRIIDSLILCYLCFKQLKRLEWETISFVFNHIFTIAHVLHSFV